MSTIQPIRRLTPDEITILTNALQSQLEAWADSGPLEDYEEDLVIDTTVLLHTIRHRQVMIDMPEEEEVPECDCLVGR